MNTTSILSPSTENELRTTDRQLVQRVLAAYQLSSTRILPPQKGYRNQSFPIVLSDRQTINLILYKIEPGIVERIKNANQVADYAAAHGLPARQTFRPEIIRLVSGQREKFGCLYYYLPGETIPWEAYTRTHLKLLGQELGKLHSVLRDVRVTPKVTDEYTAITQRMQRYFADTQVQRAIRSKLAVTINPKIFTKHLRLLEVCAQLPEQQTLHMDFVRGNILFKNETTERQALKPSAISADWRHPRQRRPHPRGLNESAEMAEGLSASDDICISGILDFEKTAHGHRLFDVARTLAFLLVDCATKSETEIHRAFLNSGYCKRGAMPRPHPQLLAALTELFLLYDFYKFLRHNPYEFLSQNHHYLRTRDLLIKKRVLR